MIDEMGFGDGMTRTVDKLQKRLQEEVFHYAQDSKKAAGRALGTLVEIITYYKMCSWGYSANIIIEKPIPEFGRQDITHNVEFSLHRILKKLVVSLTNDGSTVSAKKIGNAAEMVVTRSTEILTKDRLLRNSALLADNQNHFIVANLLASHPHQHDILICQLDHAPLIIFECKRVGVEEGMKKGPQSIEKAKQGAYVARSVSSLQKVIGRDDIVYGFLPVDNSAPLIGVYDEMLSDIVTGKIPAPKNFVLTVGVTSNHGNWFTAENHNKELKVLAAAYDWLLFLTDEGLMAFVEDCILHPDQSCKVIQEAFMQSYNGEKKKTNRFTKTRLDLKADQALRKYFADNVIQSDQWFNIITPVGKSLPELSKNLSTLLGAP